MVNEFDTEQLRLWAKRHNTNMHSRSVNNSRSIGVERVHKDVHKQFTKVMYQKNPRWWHSRIGDVVDPLNKAVYSVTGMSPYKIVFGIPGARINYHKITDKSAEARKRDQTYKKVRQRTISSKSKYSKDHDWPPYGR